jgi:hypothetical protein
MLKIKNKIVKSSITYIGDDSFIKGLSGGNLE